MNRLIEAYRLTRYLARDDAGSAAVRIGEVSPDLDELLLRNGAGSGVFITAWNPRSGVLCEEENRARQEVLERELAGAGTRWLWHLGEAQDWREEGAFALDLGFDDALALSLRFEQNAFVMVRRASSACLVLTQLGGLRR